METYDFGLGEVPAHRHPNGGGWVAETAVVAETAFVGSEAQVYGEEGTAGIHQSGHPRFHEILQELADLHNHKNHDYAAGGKPTGNFDRVSDLLTKYPGFPTATPYGVAIIYMLKQLDAALWLLSQGHESQTGEGVEQRLRDVASYAILAELLYEERYLVDSPESDS